MTVHQLLHGHTFNGKPPFSEIPPTNKYQHAPQKTSNPKIKNAPLQPGARSSKSYQSHKSPPSEDQPLANSSSVTFQRSVYK